MTLIFSGVDPNMCGFKVGSSTFETMKKALSRPMRGGMVDMFVSIQKMIPPGFDFDITGSKEFFEWYRNYVLKNLGNLRLLRSIYYSLPYSIAQVLDAVYRKLGLHIHEKEAKRTITGAREHLTPTKLHQP
jgi:hypothetical protein